MLFHREASDSGSRDGLAETGSDELVDGSGSVWVEVGVGANAASVGVLDEALGEALDGETAGESEGVGDEELDVVFEERLEGVREGESESIRGRSSGSAGEVVRVGLVVCAGVGSWGSVQMTGPSATYHTSLCRFNSFKGLHKEQGNMERPTQHL